MSKSNVFASHISSTLGVCVKNIVIYVFESMHYILKLNYLSGDMFIIIEHTEGAFNRVHNNSSVTSTAKVIVLNRSQSSEVAITPCQLCNTSVVKVIALYLQ